MMRGQEISFLMLNRELVWNQLIWVGIEGKGKLPYQIPIDFQK